MFLSPKELDFIKSIENKNDFTLAEAFVDFTECEKKKSNLFDYEFVVNLETTVHIEMDFMLKLLRRFEESGLISQYANHTEIKRYYFAGPNDETLENLGLNMTNSWSAHRYFKTPDYDYFTKNKYTTRVERNAQREKRRKFWHDWSPLLVSTVALLITAFPAFVNLVRQQDQVVVVKYESNIQEKLDRLGSQLATLQADLAALKRPAETH